MTRDELRALRIALANLKAAGVRISPKSELAMLTGPVYEPCELCGGKGVWQDDLCRCQLPHDHADDEQRASR